MPPMIWPQNAPQRHLHTLAEYSKKTTDGLAPHLTARQLQQSPTVVWGPPYHCCQNAKACFSGPVSPELVMQPLTLHRSLSQGFSMPGAGPPGRFGRGSRPDSLPRLSGREAREAFGKQDWQRGANTGHMAHGQDEPSTYCQVLN